MFSRTLRVLGRRWRLSVTVFSVVLALVAAYLVGVKGTPGFHAPATPPGRGRASSRAISGARRKPRARRP